MSAERQGGAHAVGKGAFEYLGVTTRDPFRD